MLNPPLLKEELYKRGAAVAQSKVEPLGLAYIAAALEEADHKVKIIDGIVEDTTISAICSKAQNFDFVGVSAYTTYAKRVFETVDAIKGATDVKIIVGGAHATASPLEVIERESVDFVIIGEGEQTIKELVGVSEKGKDVKKVKGLMLKGKNGKKPFFTGERPFIKNIDEIPLPARHLLPMHLYTGSEARSKRLPSHCLISSRGCPFNCTFCTKTIFGRVFRAHSPERVLEEMRILVEKYGARDIGIWDDNFTVDKKRTIKICDMMKEQNWDLSFSCEARVDCVDETVLRSLKEAGCDYVAYGIESGNQRVLDSVRKNFTKEKVMETVRLTQKIGIGVRAYFILGLPGETKEEMLDTIKFAKQLNPTLPTFTVFTPLPGTDAYAQCVKSGELKQPFYWRDQIVPDFNFLEKPICVPNGISPDELIRIHRHAYRSFYLRPSYILQRILSIRDFEDIKMMTKGLFTVLRA